jgi:hypothetical protein
MTAIVYTVQKLSGEHHFASLKMVAHTIVVVAVVLRVGTVKYLPCMNNRTFLDVVGLKNGHQLVVVAALVAVQPHHHTWVVAAHIHHFGNQFGAYWRIVGIVPPCQFVEHHQSQRVAHFVKVFSAG